MSLIRTRNKGRKPRIKRSSYGASLMDFMETFTSPAITTQSLLTPAQKLKKLRQLYPDNRTYRALSQKATFTPDDVDKINFEYHLKYVNH